MQDAVSIEFSKIIVDGTEWGFVTGLTVDGKSPEDLINCFSGTLRRRKPSTVEWSADSVTLYNNIRDLSSLKNGKVFQIIVKLDNPDKSNSDNTGSIITIQDCRMNDHSMNFGESSTFKMSGMAKSWNYSEL